MLGKNHQMREDMLHLPMFRDICSIDIGLDLQRGYKFSFKDFHPSAIPGLSCVSRKMGIMDEEAEGFGNFKSPIHPLLIDHVVRKILKYADGNDGEQSNGSNLLSYRLVCRLWNDIASSLHRTLRHVEVGSYSTSVPKFRRLIKIQKENLRYRKSRKSSLTSWPCPFSKFRLCQEVFQPIYASVISDFFQTFQDSLEVLDIWLDLRSTLINVPLSSSAKSNHHNYFFPNLKTLVYDDRRVILEDSEDSRGSLLSDLTALAPNLHQLSIRFQRDFRGSIERESIAVLSNLRKIFDSKSLQKSLKFLKLDLHINNDLLNCLTCASLRLDSLDIAIRGSRFSFLAFRQFLESLQFYLRKLKLFYIERDSNCLISFPKMSALSELEIDGTDAFSKHQVAFADFTYAESFPQLQALRINIWATANLRWSQFFPRKSAVYHLSELKLPGELCDRTTMLMAATVFPNLKRLHILVYSMTLDAMEVIFQNMGQLEELTVMKFPSLWDRNEKNIDHILTGISALDCDKISKENIELNTMTDSQLTGIKTKPGLTNLKNLRKFIMPDIQYQASYTDISGYLAFLKMPKLNYLNVGRSCLSNSCLSRLANKFPEMEAQRKIPPAYFKEPDDDDEASFLELPGDTCVYL